MSRRTTVEERKNRRKTISYILLTIIFVIFLFFYGFPTVAKLSTFIVDLKKDTQPVEIGDSTPPPPPFLNEIPEYTKESKISLSGSTEAGSTVKVYLNGTYSDVLSDSNGEFSVDLILERGENIVYAYSVDSAGNKGSQSKSYIVHFDNDPPELTISKPEDGQSFYGSSKKQLIIEGSTEPDVKLEINNRIVVVKNDGKFTHLTSLSEGSNTFNIKATDQAGNETEETISVSYYN